MRLIISDMKTEEDVTYERIVFEARDILNCGHVRNIPDALAKLNTRYNDALARIATLEQEKAGGCD